MTTDPDPYSAALATQPPAETIRDGLRGKYVCPFCGSVNDSEQGTCPRCTMENSAATRKATKTRIGPWYVLQTRNPAAPGMTWDTLVSFVRKGRVKPRSIIRGPTTHQLWRFAAHVKGLSREFGICYSCGTGVETAAALCPVCNRLQDPPPNPDALLEQSREGQTVYGTVGPDAGPASSAMTVALSGVPVAPPFGVPPFAPLSADSPGTMNDAEFVMPPLGGSPAASIGGGAVSTSAPPVAAGGTSGRAAPLAPAFAPGPVAAPPTPPVSSPVSPPGASPAVGYAGISGDPAWTRIGTVPAGVDPASLVNRPVGAMGAPSSPATAPGSRDPGSRDRGVGAAMDAGANRPLNGASVSESKSPKFNPYADDDAPASPGRRGDVGEGFLSAKDLAAAFNLGFVGEDDEAPVQRTVRNDAAASSRGANRNMPPGGWMTNPMAPVGGLDPASAVFNPPPAQTPGKKLKVLLMVVLLVGACVGMALAVSADFRSAARNWWRQISNPSARPQSGSDGGAGKPPSVTPSTLPTQPKPGTPEAESERGNGASGPAIAAGATVPPGPARPPASPQTRGAAPAPIDTSWYQSKVALLRTEGLTLEQQEKPELALEKYNQIKTFPPDTWPPDVDECISRAKKKIGNAGR